MTIKVTVQSTPKNRISINKQNRETVRTIGVSTTVPVNKLRNLVDVDSTSLDDGETVVYDSDTNQFIIKELPRVNGGTF
jgi:hypothetical protein